MLAIYPLPLGLSLGHCICQTRDSPSSDNPLCQYSPSGQQQWMYYKVVLLLNQLSIVSPSSNRLNPTENYIQLSREMVMNSGSWVLYRMTRLSRT
ncbi:hypothetical protein EUGRSUZ_K00764 [Eucalyptus grandis]|uniref:Uncharacterized protein n=2 Tax=Eucalyptus grandis TaxID=71139 RepID=A0ACC3IU53_EUCGR|nr:hypothetical protein EUGRSUZ_K00764 [Eucalyptus grandis]